MKRQSSFLQKILSAVTAFCLTFALGTAASAQAANPEGLMEAILAAKKIIDVPPHYKDLTYSMSTDDSDVKNKVWHLHWNCQDEGKTISASIDSQGNLSYFHEYDSQRDWDIRKLAAVSWEEGRRNAADFLKKAMPSADVTSHMRLEPQPNGSFIRDTYVYQYRYYANNIPATFLTVTIRADKMTGKVTEYSGFPSGTVIPSFPAPEGLIGQEGAKRAYLDQVGVSLGYYNHYDEKTKKLTIFLAYQTEGDSYTVIDAKTGEKKILRSREEPYNASFGVGMYDLSAGEGGGTEEPAPLTKEERKAVVKTTGLLSQQQAEKAVRSTLPGLEPHNKLVSSKLENGSMYEEAYYWTLNFENYYTGTVDAKTGELLSFHRPWPDSGGRHQDKKISKLGAKKYADEFLKKVLPDKASQLKYAERDRYEDAGLQYSHQLWYSRQVNGLNYYGNSILLTVTWEGAVVNLSTVWMNDAHFPTVTNAMSREQAFDLLNQNNEMILTYEREDSGKVILAYGMQFTSYDFLVDPYTGEALNLYGEPYHNASLPSYTDLAGHWSENIVMTLLENGYYLEGNQFQPDQVITQGRFLRYLYTPSLLNASDSIMKAELVSRGIVKEEEWNPSQPLSREDAARYIVRYLGLEKAAQTDGLYQPLVQDDVSEGYQGYVSLCIGMNILPTQDGKFYGSSIMTNATAAQAIYQLLRSL